MLIVSIVYGLITLASILCLGLLIQLLRHQKEQKTSFIKNVKLFFSGIIAFMMDTLGVGSFAVCIALFKHFKTFKDSELPAVLNITQVLPGFIEALLFFKLVKVDPITLLVLVTGTCIGGAIGVYKVTKLNPQGIRLIMLCGFPVIIFLLLAENYHWLPIGGELMALRGLPLLIGFFALLIAGTLTAAGIGLFALTQAILFVLGMSPIAAFPIMTAAAALQQPLSAALFLKRSSIPLKACLLVSIGGLIGVGLAMPFMAYMNIHALRALLIVVLLYNTLSIGRSFLRDRRSPHILNNKVNALHENA